MDKKKETKYLEIYFYDEPFEGAIEVKQNGMEFGRPPDMKLLIGDTMQFDGVIQGLKSIRKWLKENGRDTYFIVSEKLRYHD